MSEVKEFTGQPVLSQVMNLISSSLTNKASRKYNANRYYKKLPLRVHLVSLLYGVFSYCNGPRELCEGLLACEGKLAHLGFDKAPARSTLSDANSKRSFLVFEMIYINRSMRSCFYFDFPIKPGCLNRIRGIFIFQY